MNRLTISQSSCENEIRLPGKFPGRVLMLSLFSCIQLFATPWTLACQAPLSMGFPRQEYWSMLPFPPPGDLPDPGTEPLSPALAGRLFIPEPPGKPQIYYSLCN